MITNTYNELTEKQFDCYNNEWFGKMMTRLLEKLLGMISFEHSNFGKVIFCTSGNVEHFQKIAWEFINTDSKNKTKFWSNYHQRKWFFFTNYHKCFILDPKTKKKNTGLYLKNVKIRSNFKWFFYC